VTVTLDAVSRLLEPENRRNPYPFLHWLRENAPVHRTTIGTYLISRHDDVTQVLADSGTVFLAPDKETLERQFPGALAHKSISVFASSIALTNPPEHTRLRKVISREFTMRRVDELRPRIESICEGLLDSVSEPLRDGEIVDLQATFAEPVSRETLAELLGIPRADRQWLASLVEAVLSAFPGAPDEVLAKADAHTAELETYLTDLISERRRTPQDDLITALSNGLSEEDLVPTLWALWCAGFKTSAAGIGTGVRIMVEHPLRTDPAAYAGEVLRYDAPTIITPFVRIATEDVRLRGGTIPAGADVRLVLGAANRDPAVFADPDLFDPARDTRAMLTFTGGIHFCVGAALARTELAIALPKLRERFPMLVAAGEPDWSPALFHHMARTLPYRLA
jgi:cytochrome P450 family 114